MRKSARPKPSSLPIHKNPHLLRAFVALSRAGMGRAEVMGALRISQGTYYKCRDWAEAAEAAARG